MRHGVPMQVATVDHGHVASVPQPPLHLSIFNGACIVIIVIAIVISTIVIIISIMTIQLVIINCEQRVITIITYYTPHTPLPDTLMAKPNLIFA
jgi:hypothetical protein